MQSQSWWRNGALVILLIALLSSGVYRSWHRSHVPAQTATHDCGNLLQACKITAYGKVVVVQFSSPASGLHPFILRVMTDNASQIIATFVMRDMDMGENRYRLQAISAGHWQSQIVLPVCASGSNKWLLQLTIDGKSINIPFSN